MRPTHLQTRYRYELTPRQREVMEFLQRGLTNAEIAERLGVTLDGAKYHVREILGKLGAESREEAVALWREMPGRPRPWERFGLAWMVAGAAVVAVVVAAVVVAMVSRDGTDEPASPVDATQSPQSTPTATLTAAPVLAECTSLDVTLTLETVVRDEDVLLRLSASGTTPCRMSGPFTLGLVRPPVDPRPQYPPEANVLREMAAGCQFPFDGVIGEWRWQNWCFDPSPWGWWMARTRGDGPRVQYFADAWPPCVELDQPTWLERESFTNALGGDPTQDAACAASSLPEWLCTFATSVASDAVAGRQDLFPKRISNDVFFLCDGAGGAPGLPANSKICFEQSSNTSVRGYWLSATGGEPAFVDRAAFEAAVTRTLPTSPAVSGLSCLPLREYSCGYLSVVAGRGTDFQVALIFRLEGGREPGLVGAAVLPGGPLPESLDTPFGVFTLVPYPSRP